MGFWGHTINSGKRTRKGRVHLTGAGSREYGGLAQPDSSQDTARWFFKTSARFKWTIFSTIVASAALPVGWSLRTAGPAPADEELIVL